MPIFVDHERRRREVVAVASKLIAKAGLEAVTVRDVAEAAGCSTTIVSHYFHNKRELLLVTYNATIDRATERAEVALARSGGDIKAYLAEIMALDEERIIEWRIWIAFWARAAADREIEAIQRACVLRTRGHIQTMLDHLAAEGRLLPNLDCALQARRLLVIVMGMAVQVVFDPADWPSARQHALIDRELEALYRQVKPLKPASGPPKRTAKHEPEAAK